MSVYFSSAQYRTVVRSIATTICRKIKMHSVCFIRYLGSMGTILTQIRLCLFLLNSLFQFEFSSPGGDGAECTYLYLISPVLQLPNFTQLDHSSFVLPLPFKSFSLRQMALQFLVLDFIQSLAPIFDVFSVYEDFHECFGYPRLFLKP